MNKNSFDIDGYCIVDDFLPKDLAMLIYNLFDTQPESGWKFNHQIRPNHYEHVFKTKNLLLPNKDEVYSARFWRSEGIETSSDFKEILYGKFIDNINEMFSKPLKEFDTRAYRLNKGDYYRSHMDLEVGGAFNIIYYLNKEWIWDWGGILHICSEEVEEYCKPIFPKFNRLVLLNNKKFNSPHYISSVTEFALKPRFNITIFAN